MSDVKMTPENLAVRPAGRRRRYREEGDNLWVSVFDIAAAVLVGMIVIFGPLALGAIPQRTLLFGVVVCASAMLALLCAIGPWLLPRWQHLDRKAAGALLVFAGYVTLSMLWTPVPWASRQSVMLVLAATSMLLGVTSLIRHKWQQRSLIMILIVLGALIASYGLLQYFRGIDEVWGMTRAEQYRGRASGTYGCPNHFAGLLEMLWPFALAVVLLSDWSWSAKLASAYSLVAMFGGILFSMSRGSWLSTIPGLFFFVFLAVESRLAKLRVALLIAVGIVVVSVATWNQSEKIQERIMQSNLDDQSFVARLMMWESAVEGIKEHPVIGWGPFTYHWMHARYRDPRMQLGPRYVHNDYLQLLSEYGLIGTVLFGAAVVLVWGLLIRVYRKTVVFNERAFAAAAMTALFMQHIHGLVDFNLQIPANALVMMALVGLSLCRAKEVGVVQAAPLPRLSRGVLSFASILIVLVCFTSVWQNFWGAQHLLKGEDFASKIEWELAEEELAKAWAVDPQDYRIPTALGDLFRVQATWAIEKDWRDELSDKARNWYEVAGQLNPLSSEIVHRKAELETWAGDRAAAEALYLEAISMDPYNAFINTQYGIWLRSEDRTLDALEIFRNVLEWVPDEEASLANLKAIEAELGLTRSGSFNAALE